jgi:hypothetical protein
VRSAALIAMTVSTMRIGLKFEHEKRRKNNDLQP